MRVNAVRFAIDGGSGPDSPFDDSIMSVMWPFAHVMPLLAPHSSVYAQSHGVSRFFAQLVQLLPLVLSKMLCHASQSTAERPPEQLLVLSIIPAVQAEHGLSPAVLDFSEQVLSPLMDQATQAVCSRAATT